MSGSDCILARTPLFRPLARPQPARLAAVPRVLPTIAIAAIATAWACSHKSTETTQALRRRCIMEACRPSSSLKHLVIWFSFHVSGGPDLLQALLEPCGMGLQPQTTRIHTSVAENLHHGKHVHPPLASKTSSSGPLSACSEDRTCCGHCCNPLAWACSWKATQPTLGSGGVEDFAGAEPECQVENFGEEQTSECQVHVAYRLIHSFSGLWRVVNRLGLRLLRGFHLPWPLLQSLLHGLAATNHQNPHKRCGGASHGKQVPPLLASKTSSSDSLSECSEDRTCCGHCCNPLAWACSWKATQPTLGSGGVEDFGGAEPECQVENFGEEQKSERQVLVAYQLVHPFSGLWHVLNRLGLRLFRGFHLPLPLL